MSLERLTAQIDHLRDDMREVKRDVKSLLATKHATLGWAAGAAAVVSIVVSLLLSGCTSDAQPPNYADSWWRRTPTIEIDQTMSPECVSAAYDGVQVWLDLGVNAEVEEVGAVPDDVLHRPRAGKISLTYRESLGEIWTVTADTVGAAYSRGVLRRIRACAAAAQACQAVIFAHEIGHCLGLRHQPEPGWLMSRNAGGRAEWLYNISDEEIAWVTQ